MREIYLRAGGNEARRTAAACCELELRAGSCVLRDERRWLL
jgi:hypothetical protein